MNHHIILYAESSHDSALAQYTNSSFLLYDRTTECFHSSEPGLHDAMHKDIQCLPIRSWIIPFTCSVSSLSIIVVIMDMLIITLKSFKKKDPIYLMFIKINHSKRPWILLDMFPARYSLHEFSIIGKKNRIFPLEGRSARNSSGLVRVAAYFRESKQAIHRETLYSFFKKYRVNSAL